MKHPISTLITSSVQAKAVTGCTDQFLLHQLRKHLLCEADKQHVLFLIGNEMLLFRFISCVGRKRLEVPIRNSTCVCVEKVVQPGKTPRTFPAAAHPEVWGAEPHAGCGLQNGKSSTGDQHAALLVQQRQPRKSTALSETQTTYRTPG